MTVAEQLFARRLRIDWTRNQDGKSNSSATTKVIQFDITGDVRRHLPTLKQMPAVNFAVSLVAKLAHEYRYVPQRVALEALLGSSLRFEEDVMYDDGLRRLVVSARVVPRKVVAPTKEERTALLFIVKRAVSEYPAFTPHSESTLTQLAAEITNKLVDEYGMKISPVENVQLRSHSQLWGTFDWNGISWRFTEPSADSA